MNPDDWVLALSGNQSFLGIKKPKPLPSDSFWYIKGKKSAEISGILRKNGIFFLKGKYLVF